MARSQRRLLEEKYEQAGWLEEQGGICYNTNMNVHPGLDVLVGQLQQQLPELANDYGVASLEVFGSYVRGEENGSSDLDVLVTFNATPGLLKFIALEDRLSGLLGVPVDLVMRESLKPELAEQILKEAAPVYGSSNI